jgi:hypothetical protein
LVQPHEVGSYNVATDTDIRTLPGYQSAKNARTLAVTNPSINPDTGFPVISLRLPIFRGMESSAARRPTLPWTSSRAFSTSTGRVREDPGNEDRSAM